MIARSVGLGLAWVLLWAVSASAQDYARNGVYLGLGGSYVLEDFDYSSDLLGDVDNGWGVHLRVGYRFMANFSVEFSAELLEGLDASSFGEELDALTLGVNGKVYLETGRLQPFLMLGVGMMRADRPKRNGASLSEYNAFAARFGGGLDIYATEQLVVSLEASYVLPDGDLEGLGYGSFGWGLQYRF